MHWPPCLPCIIGLSSAARLAGDERVVAASSRPARPAFVLTDQLRPTCGMSAVRTPTTASSDGKASNLPPVSQRLEDVGPEIAQSPPRRMLDVGFVLPPGDDAAAQDPPSGRSRSSSPCSHAYWWVSARAHRRRLATGAGHAPSSRPLGRRQRARRAAASPRAHTRRYPGAAHGRSDRCDVASGVRCHLRPSATAPSASEAEAAGRLAHRARTGARSRKPFPRVAP